ncbi:MAG: hypothetical protein JJT78_08230 [Leptospira sp.]|nr:hypothetical protein [Leptospira sp.]
MDQEMLAIVIVFTMFGFFAIFVFLMIFLSGSLNYTLDYDDSRGTFVLKRGRKKIYDLTRTDIQEISLGTYRTTGNKNKTTYYTYGILLGDDVLRRIASSYPKFEKAPKDNDSVRVYTSQNMIQTRRKAEELSKKSGIPLRSLNGELRQSTELDRPFHDFMRNKIDTFGFPPRYRDGDDFEVIDGREELRVVIRKKQYYGVILGAVMFFVFGFFLYGIGELSFSLDWADKDIFEIIFLLVFNAPILIPLGFITYFYIKAKYLTDIIISKGFMKIGLKNINLNELEDIHSTGMSMTFITDKMSYTLNIVLYVHFLKMEEYVNLVKKAIVYKGNR